MTTKLTKADFLARYGSLLVTFSSYYKYTFTFTGQLPAYPGRTIAVYVGGGSDGIYRLDVTAGHAQSVESLDIEWGSIYEGGHAVESC